MKITEDLLITMGAVKQGSHFLFNQGPLFRLAFYQPPGASYWQVIVGVLREFYTFDVETVEEVFSRWHTHAVAFGVKEYKSQVRSVIHDLLNPPVP